MEDIPRKLLCSLIKQQGNSIIQDPIRFRNLLTDFTKGEYKKERKCLSDSLSEGIPDALLAKKDRLDYSILSGQLAEKLIHNLGINAELAKWTVDSWAIALGIISDDDLPSDDFEIAIISNPPGAKVSVNGNFLGVTPFSLNNPEFATYSLQISYDGYEPCNRSLEIKSKKNLTVSANLAKKPVEPGSITIETFPPNAEIFLDGKIRGRTPNTILYLQEGVYTIKLSLSGYQDIIIHQKVQDMVNVKIQEIFVPEPEKISVNNYGKISIDSSPSHAAIYFDNKYVGNTPLRLENISPGRYSLALRLSSYQEVQAQVQVARGDNISFYKKLDKQESSSFAIKAIYGLCLLLVLFFLASFFFGSDDNQGTQTILPTTTDVMSAKDLSIRTYGDFLQEGQTNTYYFDVNDQDAKNRLVKVIAQGKSGNRIGLAAGYNYVPSIDSNKYDYVSDSYTDASIDIYDLKPGRYYITVKGLQGSGDTRVSRSYY